ncbi:MAG TPA: pilus assembly PilX N-terminal domain-containing protein, partial [Gemmatimonadales bacterium]|nr:pilus assembly PilX N-terminal domain-containing protein [Gemmatimonadales bacterium]
MRQSHVKNERGMALAVAIFALVVIGALVAGVFYASSLELRSGRNSIYATQAEQAAETGPMTVLAAWDQYALNNMAVGGNTLIGTYTAGRPDLTYKVDVTRLNDQLFLISSLGARYDASGAELARNSVATLARLSFVKATAKAAVTVTKPVKFNGNSFELNGN